MNKKKCRPQQNIRQDFEMAALNNVFAIVEKLPKVSAIWALETLLAKVNIVSYIDESIEGTQIRD